MEPAIAIRYDPLSHTMLRHHSSHEHLCKFFSGNRRLTRNKTNIFRHTIHKQCNCIRTTFGDRQLSDDVCCTFPKHVVWWHQRLQQPGSFFVDTSNHDTCRYAHGSCNATLSNSAIYLMPLICDTTPGGQPKDCHDAA